MFEFAGIAGIFQQLGLDFIITMHVFTGTTQLFDRMWQHGSMLNQLG
jgi:hypothetical protein